MSKCTCFIFYEFMLTSGKSKWQVNSGKCSEKLYTYYTWGHRGAHSKSTGGLGPHFGRHSTGPQLIGLGNKPPCWPVWLEAADPSSSALQTKLSRGLRRCPLCWKLAHPRAEEQRIIGSFHAAHVNTHTHTHTHTYIHTPAPHPHAWLYPTGYCQSLLCSEPVWGERGEMYL